MVVPLISNLSPTRWSPIALKMKDPPSVRVVGTMVTAVVVTGGTVVMVGDTVVVVIACVSLPTWGFCTHPAVARIRRRPNAIRTSIPVFMIQTELCFIH